MGVLRVEVVSRAVKVHRQKVYGVVIILIPVGLGLHQQHLFSQTVGSVSLLRIALPEIFFLEGNRGDFGVGAHRADGYELTDAQPP